MNWAPYVPATGCTPFGPDGARALLVYTEDVFAELARNLGICNCRPVVGGSSFSHHAECRAVDIGFVIETGQVYAYEYVLILGEHGAEAGIDHAITNKKPWATGRGKPIIFSARTPSGRTYKGTHPHKDHDHIGLSRDAGMTLTYSKLVGLYGSPSVVAERLALVNVKEIYARRQAALIRAGYDLGDFTPYLPAGDPDSVPGADGEWGDLSRAADDQFHQDALAGGPHDHDGRYVKNIQVVR